MSDVSTRFHEHWLGLVQPIDGLVVSVPALNAAECMERQPPETQQRLIELCPEDAEGRPTISDLWAFLGDLLQLEPTSFHLEPDLPEDVQLYVPEGGQTIRPTAALLAPTDEDEAQTDDPTPAAMDDSTPASRAASKYQMLLWALPNGLSFDKPETQTGPWEYPPAAKFDRLLRECRVPIGLLVNGHALRLFYAPHGESSGSMTFRIADMTQVGGRPILDAFVMLLSDFRWFGAEPQRRLPAILRDSRSRQADVTNALADQLFEALTILLQGFEAAAERDGDELLRDALTREADHLYNGLLTLLLRLVFVLYAEDRGLMPTEQPLYGEHLSALALFESLQSDHGTHRDTMGRRFGAYPRLVALFRAVYFGIHHGDLTMPPRAGVLFDPGQYPFLEGWSAGAPPVSPDARATVRVPSVSDEAIYRVLEKLLVLGGQRLSYRALEVEQIGSVYEALMGYHVQRVSSPSVCLRPNKVWVGTHELLACKPAARERWLTDVGLPKANAKRLAKALEPAKTEPAILEVLETFGVSKIPTARAGQLVIQPGEERRRTSSHYTPRSLSEPIVRRTLEPLITAMDSRGEPPSEKLLRLKICDPAMGSGAFLVAACRFLADQVVAAWTREKVLPEIVEGHEDPVMHARRLVAQRCLYGVDKNPFAVNLAKLALWLETLAKNEPFTFLDHALKHGDSLVGLSLPQIERFDWTPDTPPEKKTPTKKSKKSKPQGHQLELFEGAIHRALLQAYNARKKLLDLAEAPGDPATLGAEKAHLHQEAEHALDRARLIADTLIGAFFAHAKDKDRQKEATHRRDVITSWLLQGSSAPPPPEVRTWVAQIRATQHPFHWPLEFPEVFWDERPDPLEDDKINRAAWIDAVVGNPPFMGQSQIPTQLGAQYRSWLMVLHPECGGKTDLVVQFVRRADWLIALHGTLGLITSNTIAQGDSREGGLAHLLAMGAVIYGARSSTPWPGAATVAISMIFVAKGTAAPKPPYLLDGTPVPTINSRLLGKPERAAPTALSENTRLSFLGCKIGGQGFVLSPAERAQLIEAEDRNSARIFKYMGGEDLNSHPRQDSSRSVIDFGQLSEQEAAQWRTLFDIVKTRVRPYRETVKRDSWRKYWWQFAEVYPSMRRAIQPLGRCLVTARVSKHLCMSFQPTDRIFSEQCNVFALDRDAHFAVLQSRIHEHWVRLLSSSMRNDLRYTASDCFETFPFPRGLDSLEDIGERLYTTRAAYMLDTDQGLTKTYNALKDPTCDDPRILDLRALHLEMDRAVLSAYGWSDIEVPPYPDATTLEEEAVDQAFEDEVLDRLFTLNAERATEEQILGKRATELRLARTT